MDRKTYYDAIPQALEADTEATAGLKKLSREHPEDRQLVILKANREYVRRIHRTMLYHNKGYAEASRIVADLDGELMQLYCFGEIVKPNQDKRSKTLG